MKYGRLFAMVLLATSLAGCAAVIDEEDKASAPLPERLVSEMASKGMTPQDPVMVRIYKQESELEIWKRTHAGTYALLKTYPMCRWSGKLGPKKREGDRQAPEGFYSVTPGLMNPRSQYYLAFNLGYPNRLEKALGYEGSALMVHGACTSSGCYAMTNNGIAEVYALAREAHAGGQAAIQVQALPFRMNAQNLASHRDDPNMVFWQNLREGVEYFDFAKQPPTVTSCAGRYRFRQGADSIGTELDPMGPCPTEVSTTAFAQLIDEHQAAENAEVASLAMSRHPAGARYIDGGMHPSFRAILRKSGPEKLAAMTSGKVEVSRPDAALADPYVETLAAVE